MWTELGIREGLSVPAGCKHQPLEGDHKWPGNRERHSTSFCFQMLRNGKVTLDQPLSTLGMDWRSTRDPLCRQFLLLPHAWCWQQRPVPPLCCPVPRREPGSAQDLPPAWLQPAEGSGEGLWLFSKIKQINFSHYFTISKRHQTEFGSPAATEGQNREAKP